MQAWGAEHVEIMFFDWMPGTFTYLPEWRAHEARVDGKAALLDSVTNLQGGQRVSHEA
jgi:hypothetical protein